MDPKSHFHVRLEELNVKVLKMALQTEHALKNACRALIDNNVDMARDVIDNDREINILECDIDEDSLRLLALEQPVAQDLRQIVGIMRIIIDLERIGDEAVNIAERALVLAGLPVEPMSGNLYKLAERVNAMFERAVTSYKDQKSESARNVCRMDEATNELHVRAIKDAMDTVRNPGDGAGVERVIHDVMIARSLERIGDQTTNIAEAVIFIVDGVSIKHHCQPF